LLIHSSPESNTHPTCLGFELHHASRETASDDDMEGAERRYCATGSD
jgi:hypothetical protein